MTYLYNLYVNARSTVLNCWLKKKYPARSVIQVPGAYLCVRCGSHHLGEKQKGAQ